MKEEKKQRFWTKQLFEKALQPEIFNESLTGHLWNKHREQQGTLHFQCQTHPKTGKNRKEDTVQSAGKLYSCQYKLPALVGAVLPASFWIYSILETLR